MSAYSELMAYSRQTKALEQVAGRLGWDQEAIMPKGAAPQRAEERAAMSSILHARSSDPRVGEWLEKAQAEETDPVALANLRRIRFGYDRTIRMPSDLAAAFSKLTSLAQGKWADAREADDFAAFAPTLKEVVELSREQADAWDDGAGRYNALLQSYEPGTSSDSITQMFDSMRPRLVALREKVLGQPVPSKLAGHYPESAQMALATELAEVFGYDLNHGRIDKVVHPFMSGSGLDVRITTRTDESDPFNCLYSTIHETGHAAYEQGIDRDYMLTPLGRGVSMGVHESQSRIYENQLGRSREFTGWLFGKMQETFGSLGVPSAEEFYAVVNRVSPGYIRTEADEIHYNLHIMLRYDLERDLISGGLEVSDLEEAWNTRFKSDFGQDVDKPSNGVLQDVHWSVGLFGYFPTYSLGNIYAGCLFEEMRRAVPEFADGLKSGNLTPATTWLRENVQVHGGLFEPQDVIERASGKAPTAEPLLSYLEEKFEDLYGLH